MKNILLPVSLLSFLLFLSGCGGHTMSLDEIYSMPDNLTVEKQVEKVNESGEKETVSEFQPYDRVLMPYPSVLFNAGGKYGLNQNLYFEEVGEDKDSLTLSDEFISVTKVFKDGRYFLMINAPVGTIDFSRKAYIGSRVKGGRTHQYALDGKVYGQFVERFSWEEVKPIEDYSNVLISKNVQLNSAVNRETGEFFVSMVKEVEKTHLPNCTERIFQKIGKITQNDVIFAGATDLTVLYAVVGVRVFAVLEAVLGEADLNLPYYETSGMTQFQHSYAMDPVYKSIERDEIESAAYMKLLGRTNRLYDEYEERLRKKR